MVPNCIRLINGVFVLQRFLAVIIYKIDLKHLCIGFALTLCPLTIFYIHSARYTHLQF